GAEGLPGRASAVGGDPRAVGRGAVAPVRRPRAASAPGCRRPALRRGAPPLGGVPGAVRRAAGSARRGRFVPTPPGVSPPRSGAAGEEGGVWREREGVSPGGRPVLTSAWYARLALAYLGFVVYGSLVPFHFRPMPVGEAVERFRAVCGEPVAVGSRSDWTAN